MLGFCDSVRLDNCPNRRKRPGPSAHRSIARRGRRAKRTSARPRSPPQKPRRPALRDTPSPPDWTLQDRSLSSSLCGGSSVDDWHQLQSGWHRLRSPHRRPDPPRYTTSQRVKHPPKNIALAKAIIAGAREGRVVGDRVFQAQITEPAIGEVDLNLSANLPL